jgi:hypothetical protein
MAYMAMRWENMRRDAAAVAAGEETRPGNETQSQAILDGFKDMTDMESKHFRYAL